MQFPLNESDLIPNHPRSDDFKVLLEAVETRLSGPYRVLETGTMRNGDFGSTQLFDKFVNFHGGSVKTFDLDPALGEHVRKVCSDKVEAITGDAVKGIFDCHSAGERFNVAWLDSYDVLWVEPHASAHHHLMELAAALRVMDSPSIIAVDDNRLMQNVLTGKGKYIADFMKAVNAEPIVMDYIYAWLVR